MIWTRIIIFYGIEKLSQRYYDVTQMININEWIVLHIICHPVTINVAFKDQWDQNIPTLHLSKRLGTHVNNFTRCI